MFLSLCETDYSGLVDLVMDSDGLEMGVSNQCFGRILKVT